MKKLMLRPALLALLVVLSVFAVRQVTAATISDLGEIYSGTTHSHVDPESELIEAGLSIDSINRSTFTGVFADGRLEFQVRGTVSRTGKVSFSGKFEEDPKEKFGAQGGVPVGPTKLTIKGNGQLSATGGFFLGTATEQGKLNGERFKDSISFALQNDDFVPEEFGAASAKGK